MAAERVTADVSERAAPRARRRIVLLLSTMALIAAGFAGCASVGPTGVTANALEGSDRVVWDCGWRTMP